MVFSQGVLDGFQLYIKGIWTINMFSRSIKWYIEAILKNNQRYINGILTDILKAGIWNGMSNSKVFQKEYFKYILKVLKVLRYYRY